jgi:hypothetical protein
VMPAFADGAAPSVLDPAVVGGHVAILRVVDMHESLGEGPFHLGADEERPQAGGRYGIAQRVFVVREPIQHRDQFGSLLDDTLIQGVGGQTECFADACASV